MVDRQNTWKPTLKVVLLCAAGLGAIHAIGTAVLKQSPLTIAIDKHLDASGVCENPPKVVPELSLQDVYQTENFRDTMLKNIQGAVQIATESNEDYDSPDVDPRWEVFDQLHEYLKKTYPLIHKHVKREIVNKYGLVYTWEGTDNTKDPVLLMAHQDVVPVLNDTIHDWTYDPYSAHFDGHFIWGRGVLDDKHPLLSSLSAIELLLKEKFQPSRTIVLAFGHDEESGGIYGAQHISQFLESRYGKEGFYSIIDEGGLGVSRVKGTNVAIVGVGEKGRYANEISLYTKGGHGSMPHNSHTAIGIMSEVLYDIENNPYPMDLPEANPFLQFVQCLAVHSDEINYMTSRIMLAAGKNSFAKKQVINSLAKIPYMKFNMLTTQAINVIKGGMKLNALPEKVVARMDNRLAPQLTCLQAAEGYLDIIRKVAVKHNLGLIYGNETLIDPVDGQYFEYQHFGPLLDPSPVSPTGKSAQWSDFAGAVRYVYEDLGGPLLDHQAKELAPVKEGREVIVAPSIMTANTDTRYMWNLSKYIYRFTPLRVEDDPAIHTVNEHISLDGHIEGVAFYHAYIQNVCRT